MTKVNVAFSTNARFSPHPVLHCQFLLCFVLSPSADSVSALELLDLSTLRLALAPAVFVSDMLLPAVAFSHRPRFAESFVEVLYK